MLGLLTGGGAMVAVEPEPEAEVEPLTGVDGFALLTAVEQKATAEKLQASRSHPPTQNHCHPPIQNHCHPPIQNHGRSSVQMT